MNLECCPFCGEKMKLELHGAIGDDDWYIQCQTCTATGPFGEDKEIAVAQWNNDFRAT